MIAGICLVCSYGRSLCSNYTVIQPDLFRLAPFHWQHVRGGGGVIDEMEATDRIVLLSVSWCHYVCHTAGHVPRTASHLAVNTLYFATDRNGLTSLQQMCDTLL